MDDSEILRRSAAISGRKSWEARVRKYGKEGAVEILRKAVNKRIQKNKHDKEH